MQTSAYILHKTQNAARDWLLTQELYGVTNIYSGVSSSKRNPPCVICYCMDADHSTQLSGNFLARLVIQLRSDSDLTTEEDHHERAEILYNLIATDTFATNISGVLVDFHCHQALVKSQRFAIEESHWVSEFEVECDVCGSDIS